MRKYLEMRATILVPAFSLALTACGGGATSGNPNPGNSSASIIGAGSSLTTSSSAQSSLSSQSSRSASSISSSVALSSVVSSSSSSQSSSKSALSSSMSSSKSSMASSSKISSSKANSAQSSTSNSSYSSMPMAFFETFDAPSVNQGRAGELDATIWSASRTAPQAPTGNNVATAIGPATIGICRNGLPAQVLPPQDTLICEANTSIASPHLMTAVAAQHYGQNSYRVRQPFDFSGRTGKIVFDVDASVQNRLIGWISIEVVEDPTNAPNFVIDYDNDEDAAVPKNAFELQFQTQCFVEGGSGVSLRMVQVYDNYQPTTLIPDSTPCIPTLRDHLNHFEVRVSQSHIEIWGTPPSADGKTFAAAQLLYSTALNLSFSRGYLSITTHNHASIKYADLDAWVTRWDNIGFDGPVITNWREFEVPDALTPGLAGVQATDIPARPVVSIGYVVADAKDGPAQTLRLPNVNLEGVVSARLSVAAWYLNNPGFGADPPSFILRYRFNGKAWRDRKLSPEEVGVLTYISHGQISQMLDVSLNDLVQGDNTLEFVTLNVPRSYPPLVQNIDLVLTTQ
jgi:hypothetical protein